MADDLIRIEEVGDHRLSDGEFLASFRLPSSTKRAAGKLAALHPLYREDRIYFDEESHTYTYDGVKVPRSVTSLLHHFASKFDPHVALQAMQNSHTWEDKREGLEMLGLVTDDLILQHWKNNGKIQSARGTLLHFHAECLMNGVRVEEPHSIEFQQVQQIYDYITNTMGFRPHRAEVCLYHSKLRCAGQADVLLCDAMGDIVIGDWKRIKDLRYENRYNRLMYPLCHLDDSWSDRTNVFENNELGLRVADNKCVLAKQRRTCGHIRHESKVNDF